MNTKRLSKEEFIEKSNLKHNFKYSYDKVKYINNKSKVIITCPIHGDFTQSPKSHYLNGNGCQLCYGNNRNTLSNFIDKSKLVHKNKYTYSKVNYINNITKVTITCLEHGDFEQIPKSHLRGFGCRKCSGLEKLTTGEFIKKSNVKHNFKYKYDKSVYINNQTRIIINCEKHGYFDQLPSNHLNGSGCKKCKIDSMFNTKEYFINKSNIIHNFFYSYDLVNYERNDIPVEIICKEHGSFIQTPHGHLNGRGCSRCRNSKGEKLIEYLLCESNLNYKTQIRMEELKHVGDLRFDFGVYIGENLQYLIEYNGQQHYKFIKYFHVSEQSFIDSNRRDQIKTEYCDKNKIKLYIIRYDDNVEEKIKEILEYEKI